MLESFLVISVMQFSFLSSIFCQFVFSSCFFYGLFLFFSLSWSNGRNNIWYYVMKIIFIISYNVINININNRLLGGTKFSQNISSCTDTCCFYKPKRTINLNLDFLFWQSSNFVKKKSSPLILKSFQFLIYRRIFLIEGTFSKLNYRKIDMERNYVNKRQKKDN